MEVLVIYGQILTRESSDPNRNWLAMQTAQRRPRWLYYRPYRLIYEYVIVLLYKLFTNLLKDYWSVTRSSACRPTVYIAATAALLCEHYTEWQSETLASCPRCSLASAIYLSTIWPVAYLEFVEGGRGQWNEVLQKPKPFFCYKLMRWFWCSSKQKCADLSAPRGGTSKSTHQFVTNKKALASGGLRSTDPCPLL